MNGIEVEDCGRTVVIDGNRFDREIFKYFASGAIGSTVKFINRDDGVVTLEKLSEAKEA